MGLLFFPTYIFPEPPVDSRSLHVLVRKTKDKKDMHTLHHISTTVALQKIQVQKRQKDIHPAQTQHNTQQDILILDRLDHLITVDQLKCSDS